MKAQKHRLTLLTLLCILSMRAGGTVWYDGTTAISYSIPHGADPVVEVAAGMFATDMEAVTGSKATPEQPEKAIIRLYQLDTATKEELDDAKGAGIDISTLQSLTDGFAIQEKEGTIHIAGTNGRGTAYGLLEMSRKAGVSPWEWWGDAVPAKKNRLEIETGFSDMQGASVENRGIIIANEQWSLRPWSHQTFEPSDRPETGPLTYRKIFELLLRLRGNTLQTREGDSLTKLSDAAKAQADSCAIITQPTGHTPTECHLSHRGAPHDYLWLTTTQPGLIWHQLREAYDAGQRDLWTAEIHDPKTAGYDLELFMDLAWDIDCTDASSIRNHYKEWLTREFGKEATELIFPAMHDFYRLCGERRPEYMGWSQTGKDPTVYERGMTPVRSTELNPEEFGDELERYIEEFDRASYVVDYATKLVDRSLYDAYYTAIIYPVCASAAHARSLLNAQKARTLASQRECAPDLQTIEGLIRETCTESQRAYQEVRKLTEYYNDVVSDGKWKGIMDMRPNDLPVFSAPSLPMILTEVEMAKYPSTYAGNPRKATQGECVARNAESYARLKGDAKTIGMLGHSMNAVALAKGSTLNYDFETSENGEGLIRIATIPALATDPQPRRLSISIDGGKPTTISIDPPKDSEQWKESTLRGQTLTTLPATLKTGKHTLEIKALDDGSVIDQWMWDPDADRQFYLFPL